MKEHLTECILFFASGKRPSARMSRDWSDQSTETSITEQAHEPRARL